MKERLPRIDVLKQAEKIGENNLGFLEPRSPLSEEDRKVVDEENEDRRAVYRMIARRTGQTVEEVGRQRAAQIASRSTKGVWLQDARGKWYRK